MDINHLLSSLENENNESIMKLTSSKISDEKNNILQKLQLERNELKELNKKLKAFSTKTGILASGNEFVGCFSRKKEMGLSMAN